MKTLLNNKKTFLTFALLLLIIIVAIVYRTGNKSGSSQDGNIVASVPNESESKVGETIINGGKVKYSYTEQDEDDIGDYEGNPPMYESNGYYTQNIIEYQTRTGGTLSLGVDDDSNEDCLYLNPVYEPLNDECLPWCDITQFGFYIKSDYGEIYSCNDRSSNFDSEINKSRKSLLIKNQFYDTCVPADFVNTSDYGVIWTDVELSMGAQPVDEVNLQIRIIRLFDATLMDIVHAKIIYDKQLETYRLTSIANADVSNTGELSVAERSLLVQMAKDYLVDDNKTQNIIFSLDDWDWAVETAIVEHSGKPYFPQIINMLGEYTSVGKYSHCDVYAVNMSYVGYGYFTVYIAPSTQIQGFTSAIPIGQTRPDYSVLGYDVLFPQSEATAAIPQNVN